VQSLCTTNRSRRRGVEIVKLCVHLFTNALPHVPSANEAGAIAFDKTAQTYPMRAWGDPLTKDITL